MATTALNGANISDEQIEQLRQLRPQLLRLHKTLLEMERINFERTFGHVTRGELLQLVINHAQFAWLRRLSEVVVQIDELLYSKEPVMETAAQNLLEQVRALFASSGNDEFGAKYQQALQQEPGAVMEHAQIMKIIAADKL